MSAKLNPAANSRHTPGGHPKSCPVCNPRKSKKYAERNLAPTRRKEKLP